MFRLSLTEQFRRMVAEYSFKVLLWAEQLTEEEYWKLIQKQENEYDDHCNSIEY